VSYTVHGTRHTYMMATAFLFLIFSVESSSHFSVTSDPDYQWNPALHGDMVVWEDSRNGNWDIYGYDLSTKTEIVITVDRNRQGDPAVYNDTVVWTDYRNGNPDIYGYDLASQQEFIVTSDVNGQQSPAIYNNIVVWQDNRNGNWDIYGVNLQTGEEFQVTADTHDQVTPQIYGTTLVWEDDRNQNWDIYGYNLGEQKEFQITVDTAYQGPPAVYNGIVVWEDHRNGNAAIYMYDIQAQKEVQITSGREWQGNPAIYNDIIIWVDERKGTTDIYGYDLLKKEELQITKSPLFSFSVTEYSPLIFGNMVVWADSRHGNTNIYAYDLQRGSTMMSVVVIFVCGVIVLLILRQRNPYSFWMFFGIIYAVLLVFLEEAAPDVGTVLLFVGTPFISMACVVVSWDRYTPVVTVSTMFAAGYLLEIGRVNLGLGAIVNVFFWTALYSLLGIALAWAAQKRSRRSRMLKGLFCPNCGKEIQKTWNMCPYCKTNLDYTQFYDDGTQIY
jgi:TolB protein